MVEVAASMAQAASTALLPFWNIMAPAVAPSGLPVMATQCRPWSTGLAVAAGPGRRITVTNSSSVLTPMRPDRPIALSKPSAAHIVYRLARHNGGASMGRPLSRAGAGTPPAPAIRLWRSPETPGVELRTGSHVSAPVARHWHDEYQLCLIETGGGWLFHRGVAHETPAGSLFVLAPGEVHANAARDGDGCSFRSLYAGADVLGAAAGELGRAGLPDFPRPMVDDRALLAAYLRSHRALVEGAPRLERESRLLGTLVALVQRHAAGGDAAPRPRCERGAVGQARAYLHAHFAEPVALSVLARVAGLSAFHLTRVFCAELGLPPHAYQTQLRVHAARRLIEAGEPLVDVARTVGFADQSHLSRHFRRLLGVPPGAYRAARGKNVQDNRRRPR